MSKEELEIVKLEQEITNLKKKFYERPEFLSIIVSSVFAALALYTSLVQARSSELEEVKTENTRLANQINDFEKRRLQVQKEEIEQSIDDLKVKEQTLEDSLNNKFMRDMLVLEDRLKGAKKYIEEYSISYSNEYVDSRFVKDSMDQFIKPDQQEAFKRWLYSALRRAIALSNDRTIEKIELERKLIEYSIK
jgi:hypothetical protein